MKRTQILGQFAKGFFLGVFTLSSGLAAKASSEDFQKQMEEMQRKLDVLSQEFERSRMGEVAAKADQSQYGFGPAASKVYRSKEGVSIGGYGEFVYQNFERSTDSGTYTSAQDQINAQRLVLYFGYKFSEKIILNTELEFEHGTSSANRAGNSGSWGLEFAYLDFMIHKNFNVRAGNMLIPMGLINELHEPTVFLGVRRPEVEQFILPSTWRENGAGLFGDIGDFSYRAYLVNGFDAGNCRGSSGSCGSNTGFSASGIRSGRQNGGRAFAQDFAAVARVDYHGVPGMLVGGSVYTGDAGQDQTSGSVEDIPMHIAEVHFDQQWKGWQFRALGAMTWIESVAALNNAKGLSGTDSIGSRQYGVYGEIGYDVGPHLKSRKLVPFTRYEVLNSQAQVPAGFYSAAANQRSVWTHGLSYFPHPQVVVKADVQNFRNRASSAVDQFNLGLGFIF